MSFGFSDDSSKCHNLISTSFPHVAWRVEEHGLSPTLLFILHFSTRMESGKEVTQVETQILTFFLKYHLRTVFIKKKEF